MRDTFIALLVLGGMVGAYAYLKRTGNLSLSPSIGSPAQMSVAPRFKQKKSSSLSLAHAQGAKHGEKPNRHNDQQAANHGKDEGVANDVAEAQGLPSIYQEEPPAKQRVATHQGGKRAKPTILHGVPIEAWIRSRQDALPGVVADNDSETGIRVFLQCMELKKKGPQYLGERECDKLVKSRITSAIADQREPRPASIY